MDATLERCLDELLARGTDDWCGPLDVLGVASTTGGAKDAASRMRLACLFVEAALVGGWMQVGDAGKAGFRAWPDKPPQAMLLIQKALQTHVEQTEPYGWFWLNNTPEGDRRGEAVLSSRSPSE